MKKSIYLIILFIFILTPACESNLSSQKEVIKLEVLSIKSNKPQVHPGDSVDIEALIGSPEGYSQEYHKIWILCDPQFDPTGLSCMSPNQNNIVSTSIDEEKFNATIPTNTLSDYNMIFKDLYVLLILCKADTETCLTAMGNQDEGLNTEILTLSYKKISVIPLQMEIYNHNPVIKTVYLDDEEVIGNTITLSEDKDKNIFKVLVSSDSFDKKRRGEELVDEKMYTNWKSNAGMFNEYTVIQQKTDDYEKLDKNQFIYPKGEKNFKIYIITTDDQGGMDWKVLSVNPE